MGDNRSTDEKRNIIRKDIETRMNNGTLGDDSGQSAPLNHSKDTTDFSSFSHGHAVSQDSSQHTKSDQARDFTMNIPSLAEDSDGSDDFFVR